jgi:DNA-binding transcriptional LysR family regulator
MIAGSITEASKAMHISQPSVSRLIADLERAVGFGLFERKHGRIYPTAEAVDFFEEVERSFLGLDRLMRYARNIADLRDMHLTISGMPALSIHLIPMVIAKFVGAYPTAKITVEARSSERVVDWIARQRADVGFVARPYDVPGVACCLEMTMPCILVLKADHRLAARERVSFADLRGEKIINLMNASVRADLREKLGRVNGEDNEYIESTLSSVVLKLVELGLGVGLIEPLSARAMLNDKIVIRQLEETIPFDFGMVAPERRASSKLLAQIRDMAVSSIEELSASYGVEIEYRLPTPGA